MNFFRINVFLKLNLKNKIIQPDNSIVEFVLKFGRKYKILSRYFTQ